MTVFHRGAAVSQPLFFKGAKLSWDRPNAHRWRWDLLRDVSKEVSADTLARFTNPARQRRKGPITRYGVKQ